MHIRDILEKNKTTLSFEFFPPKTEKASQSLFENIKNLTHLQPGYISVTYGAGGSTRELTRELVKKLHLETDLTIIPHLTCVGSTQEEVYSLLKDYDQLGIGNIMALRGDPPKGQTHFATPSDGFPFAKDLVHFIKKNFPNMGVGVAGFPEGHPETPNRLKEIEYLKEKVDAGADYICTQLFFDNNDFYDYSERCKISGINIPIVAGIMPVTSLNNMVRMAELAQGARFPAKLMKAVSRTPSDEYTERVGIQWASEQVRDLIDHDVKGIHFYTLNRSAATQTICENLGIRNSLDLNQNLLRFNLQNRESF